MTIEALTQAYVDALKRRIAASVALNRFVPDPVLRGLWDAYERAWEAEHETHRALCVALGEPAAWYAQPTEDDDPRNH